MRKSTVQETSSQKVELLPQEDGTIEIREYYASDTPGPSQKPRIAQACHNVPSGNGHADELPAEEAPQSSNPSCPTERMEEITDYGRPPGVSVEEFNVLLELMDDLDDETDSYVSDDSANGSMDETEVPIDEQSTTDATTRRKSVTWQNDTQETHSESTDKASTSAPSSDSVVAITSVDDMDVCPEPESDGQKPSADVVAVPRKSILRNRHETPLVDKEAVGGVASSPPAKRVVAGSMDVFNGVVSERQSSGCEPLMAEVTTFVVEKPPKDSAINSTRKPISKFKTARQKKS